MKKLLIGLLIGLGLTAGVAMAGTIGGTRVNQGGTGNITVNHGSLLVGSTTNNSLLEVATGSAGSILQMVNNIPSWQATSTLGLMPLSTGTTGLVTRWDSATQLTTGTLIDNGTVAGQNATSSTVGFLIQGSSGTTPFQVASSTGTALITVTQAGNVGIGTTTPGRTLTVVGDMRATGILYDSNNSAGSSGNFLMSTATGYQWTSTSTIFGGSQVTGSGTNGYVTRWTGANTIGTGILLDSGSRAGINATSSSYTFNIQGSSGVAPLNIASSSGTSLVMVSQVGNVGIGTTSPASKLQVYGTDGNTAITLTDTAYNSVGYKLVPTRNGTNSGFGIYDNTNSAYRFVIDNNGNVGIGTTSPTSKLQVEVAGGANGNNPITSSVTGIRIKDTSLNGNYSDVGLLMGGGGTGGKYAFITAHKTDVNNVDLSLGVNDAEAVRILSNGNVGIGTTSPLYKLEVNGTAMIAGNNFLYSNRLRGYAGDNLHIDSGVGQSMYLNYYQGNDIFFGTGANGVWKSSGNVGIGTTTPASKLQVVGDLRLGHAAGTAGQIIFQNNANSFTTTVKSSSSQASSLTFTLPPTSGSAGQLLASDGAGITYWATDATGASTGNAAWTILSGAIHNATSTDEIGIGTTTPDYTLTIQGNGATNPFRIASSTGTNLITIGSNGSTTISSLAAAGLVRSTSAGSLYVDTGTYLQDGCSDCLNATEIEDIYLLIAGDSSAGNFTWTGTHSFSATTTMATTTITYLGVGTTTPLSMLDVAGTAQFHGAGNLVGLKVFSNGNVGIGSTTSSELFTIGDNNQFRVNSSGSVQVAGTIYGNTYIDSTQSNYLLQRVSTNTLLGNASGGLLVIQDNGNVGVGTTTPATKLSVVGTAGANNILTVSSSTGTSILRVEHDGDVIVRDNRYGEYKVKPMTSSILIASTSLDTLGKQLSNATTTFIRRYPYPVTLVEIGGETISAGTALCRAGDGTNFTGGLGISTTYSTTTPASNNTWVADEKIQFEIGSAASTPQGASCNFTFMPTP